MFRTRAFSVRVGKLLLALGTLAFIASCQVIASRSDFADGAYGIAGLPCSTDLGSYALPFSKVPIKIYREFNSSGEVVGSAVIEVKDTVQHPDPEHRFCLEFKDNSFSKDSVDVYMSRDSELTLDGSSIGDRPATNSLTDLLALVVSKSEDRTGVIIQNLLQAFLIAQTRDSDFTLRAGRNGNSLKVVYEDSFDPLSLSSIASANRRLARFGFCLTLGKYTVDPKKLDWSDYCDNPSLASLPQFRSNFADIAKEQRFLKPRDSLPAAIYYRPRLRYALNVYSRRDPTRQVASPSYQRNDDWRLIQLEQIALENASPIIGLGVSRALFAENRIAFAFDKGNLLDVCLLRSSSALGAVEIPINIVKGIVDVPVKAAERAVAVATLRTDLLERQKNILELQTAIIRDGTSANFDGISNQTSLPSGIVGTTVPTSKAQNGAKLAVDKIDDFKSRVTGVCPILEDAS